MMVVVVMVITPLDDDAAMMMMVMMPDLHRNLGDVEPLLREPLVVRLQKRYGIRNRIKQFTIVRGRSRA